MSTRFYITEQLISVYLCWSITQYISICPTTILVIIGTSWRGYSLLNFPSIWFMCSTRPEFSPNSYLVKVALHFQPQSSPTPRGVSPFLSSISAIEQCTKPNKPTRCQLPTSNSYIIGESIRFKNHSDRIICQP